MLLKVVIDVDGKAKDIEVVNGLGLGLDEQAVLAIQQWKFNPGMKDGVPVPVLAHDRSQFQIDVTSPSFPRGAGMHAKRPGIPPRQQP